VQARIEFVRRVPIGTQVQIRCVHVQKHREYVGVYKLIAYNYNVGNRVHKNVVETVEIFARICYY